MSHIYALLLEQNKYYVGQTNNPNLRIEQHCDGHGSAWTLKYKPIKVLFVKPSMGPFDENNTTKMLMLTYGIDNVRGGTYCIIDDLQKELLKKELWGISNKCIRCGYDGHFINACRKKIDVNGDKITLKSTVKRKKVEKVDNKNNDKNNDKNNNKNNVIEIKPKIKICKSCGRNSHITKDCYATTKITGSPMIKKPCTRCHRMGHKKTKCYATSDVNGKLL